MKQATPFMSSRVRRKRPGVLRVAPVVAGRCGHALVAGRVLKVDGTDALVCPSGAECQCAFNPADSTKCGCGKPVRKMSLEGSGLYVCACGSSCCTTISAGPGKCKCGMALKRVD